VLLNLVPNEIPISTWIAVGLSALSIGLIGWPSKGSVFSIRGLLLAVAGAAGFGLLDSLVPYFTHKSDPFFLLFIVLAPLG
jgi:hypothetical protein